MKAQKSKSSVITFKNVSKLYATSKGKYGLLRELISDSAHVFRGNNFRNKEQVAALSNISFDIESGECIGIIGNNGAGKSTILKLISKITYPHSGKIEVKGKIGAFIELGAGLHHELTGRENIYLYGAILGMKKQQIKEKFDDIVDFAEIRSSLDIPIKKYSSGMYSRLGFSVCAFSDPDILLVDEVLAVGDINFQKKCLEKMHEMAERKTVVFVSHNLEAIQSICKRVIYIEQGKIIKMGKAKDVINYYRKVSKAKHP